jgi:hypothetical protein
MNFRTPACFLDPPRYQLSRIEAALHQACYDTAFGNSIFLPLLANLVDLELPVQDPGQQAAPPRSYESENDSTYNV